MLKRILFVALLLAAMSGSSLSASAPVRAASLKSVPASNRITLSLSIFWVRWLPMPLTFIPSASLVVNTNTGQTVRAGADGKTSIDVQVGDVLKVDEYNLYEVAPYHIQAGFMLISLGEIQG
jgi:hypothetical protein